MTKTRITTLTSMQKLADTIAVSQRAWALYLSTSDPIETLAKDSPVPHLSPEDRMTLRLNGWILFVINDESAATAMYQQVVGDDGPIRANPYKGPHRVYAYLAGPDGGITENT